MTGFSDSINDILGTPASNSARQSAVGSVEDDPEQAARAIQLGRETGVPSSAIYGDVKGFEQQHKSVLASDIIANNPYLVDYVNSHPLAAKVSNDDWANLDELSEKIPLLARQSPLEKFIGETKGIWEGFSFNAGRQNWNAKDWEWAQQNQGLAALAATAATPVDFLGRLLGTGLAGLDMIGGRDLAAMGEWMVTRGDIATGPKADIAGKVEKLQQSATEAIGPARIWLDQGKPPPPGVHPFWDSFWADQAKVDKDALKEITKAANATNTRARSPEFIEQFIRSHGDQDIKVTAKGLEELYGDKPPAPDDNLLGWVPGLVERYESIIAAGDDINIPLSQWLARVEPEVANQLYDHLRLRKDGVSVEEAKELGGAKEPVKGETAPSDDPLEAVRNQAALKPLFEQVEETKPEGEASLKDKFDKALTDPEDILPSALKGVMTAAEYKRYRKLIDASNEADKQAAVAKAVAMEKKKQTAEWRAEEAKVRDQVAHDVEARPDIAVTTWVRENGVKIGEGYLTKEQKEALPKSFVGKDGIDPDDMAGHFGYQTGKQLMMEMAKLEQARGEVPLKDYIAKQIKEETAKRMEQLGANHAEELARAADEAAREIQIDLLHAETKALARKAGIEDYIGKDQIKEMVERHFDGALAKDVTVEDFLSAAGRAGRLAEKALLKEDWQTAFQEKQRQQFAMMQVKLARKLVKEKEQFDRFANRFSAREVKSVDQEYTNFIHSIMLRAGLSVKRSVEDLGREIGAQAIDNLQEFIAHKQGMLRELPIADFLLDPAWRKPFEQLTVEEFRALKDSLKTLAHNGAEELKIYKAGEAADFAEVKAKMLDQLKEFKEVKLPAKRGFGQAWYTLKTFGAAHIQIESLFNRWDRGNPKGVWTQYVMRDLADSAKYEAALEKEYAKKLKEINKDNPNLNERIENDVFLDPYNKTPLSMTRRHLRGVIQNMGNKSNFDKLVRGWNVDPKKLMDWVAKHSTKEDWDWAQKQGELFAELKELSDKMYRNLTGVAPENIDLQPIQTPFGTYKGWYHPVVYDSLYLHQELGAKGAADMLQGHEYFRASTPAGYTKKRTNFAAPMELDINTTPLRLRQMIHDIAFRPSVINASKVFYDKEVQTVVQRHYGNEYAKMLVPFLEDVARSANYRSEAAAVGARASEFFRQNLIGTLIGLNPGTVVKHSLTAWVQSVKEAGGQAFLKEMLTMYTKDPKIAESNWSFALKTSEELQRRHRHYSESLIGANEEVLADKGKLMTMRDTMLHFGSKPVAMGDLFSAVPTWLAVYKQAIRDGDAHGDAVFAADRAVRRAHGSTAITNRPAIMRGGAMAQWYTSLFGFFNHIMNRQYEMMWKAADTIEGIKSGDRAKATEHLGDLTTSYLSYILIPAIIEELVTPTFDDEGKSWGVKLMGRIKHGVSATGQAINLSASWTGVRDMAKAMAFGRDPAVGLMSTFTKEFTDLGRDFTKKGPMTKDRAATLLRHSILAFGAMSGLANAQMGRSAEGLYRYMTGQARPREIRDWLFLLRAGRMEKGR